MNRNLLMLLSGATLAATLGSDARALPLQRADVPADPSWIIHVDCDALRPTTIGQFVLSELDKPENQAKIASFQSVFNLDPRTKLHGLTLYSLSGAPEDGVLLVYADFDAERLTGLAQGASDHQSTTHNKHLIHNWIRQEKRPRKTPDGRVYAAIQGPRVIFGQREGAVAAALDVLDGASPNLTATRTYSKLGTTGNHSFALAAARKIEMPDKGPQAAILRLAKGLRLEIGEDGSQTIATLNVEATGEDVAGQIAAVGQGLLALLKLQSDKPEAARLAEAISLKQDGSSVVVKLAMPADTAVQLIKADEARKARKKAAAKSKPAEQ